MTDKWISVEDDLPKDQQIVLVVYDGFTSYCGHVYHWLDGAFLGLDGHYTPTDKLTYWMPLPEPPEEKQQ